MLHPQDEWIEGLLFVSVSLYMSIVNQPCLFLTFFL